MNLIKAKRITALLLAAAMIFAGTGLGVQSYGATSRTTKVYVTVSDKGQIAASGSKVMADVPVTVTTAKAATLDDVMKAVHKKYKAGGYATAKGMYGDYVAKLWGDESGNYLFFLNNNACTSGIKAETVKNGDHITASVNSDNTYYSDYYSCFNKRSVTAVQGETVKLSLAGFAGMAQSTENTAIADAQIGLVTSEGFTALDNVTTDKEGNAYIKLKAADFKAGKTYYVSATGTVAAKATDWSTGNSVDVDAPIIAPVCKITVTDRPVCMTNTENYLINRGQAQYGDEWMVIAFARGGAGVKSSYYTKYAEDTAAKVKKAKGVLSASKSATYSKVVLAYTAMGKDPAAVGGYNLIKKLEDIDFVCKQGVTGPIWALMALDSGNYQSTAREALIEAVLKNQLEDGSFSLTQSADADITAMAVQALAKYYDSNSDVKSAVDKALAFLSENQNEDGTFSYYGTKTSETVSQVIVALTEMGINPQTDERFIKNGNTLIGALMSFYKSGSGFRHVYKTTSGSTGPVDVTASQQAYYALNSYYRLLNDKNSLYTMTDGKAFARPAKVSVTSLKSTATGKATLKWSKLSGVKEYQIRYSKSSSFSSYSTATVSGTSTVKTLKSLSKGKYYYVKIRASRTDSAGNKYYGNYSTVKKVKVK